ncbi:MAG: DUF1634 domain-containing protein [Candidatus Aminicenantales bacterium]|jgi:uncharacterized membrane protein
MDSPENSRPESGHGWTGDQVDRIISNLLRLGLVLSAAVVAVGAAIYLARHGNQATAYRVFRGEPPDFRLVENIFTAGTRFRGRGFIMAGLLLLIATPVARVAFSVLAFLRQRDHIFAAVTIFVLAVLLFSIFWLGVR